MFAFDRDRRYFHWSPGMEAMIGLTADEVLGRTATELFPFLNQAKAEEAHARAMAGETVVVRDRSFFVPETGREGTYEATYRPLYDAAKTVRGVVGIVRETTQERLAAALLEETEGRFKNMADASPVLLWMSRADSLCTFFNQTWLEFT